MLILSLASCSSENDAQEDDDSSEIVYADVKPTQTKYKAFYGQKLTKNITSVASRSAEATPNTEMTKPVSVIFYPRTQTISFSNIFDNKTLEYKVTGIETIAGVSVIYNFKINEATFKCTISEKTASSAANVIITFTGGFYKFDLTDSAKKNIAKLLSKVTFTSQYIQNNYTTNYVYSDTLLVQAVRNYYDQKTLEPLISIVDYGYEGAKLVSKTTKKADGTLVKTTNYKYENNVITKAIHSTAESVTGETTYKYDNQGRVISSRYLNNLTGYDDIMNFSYEKNKLTTIYTNSEKSYYDTEVLVYNSDRKVHLISQDDSLYPLLNLDITSIVTTDNEGHVYSSAYSYEFSPEGFMLKMTEQNSPNPSIQVREYVEE